MRILLDTHIMLWLFLGSKRLGNDRRRCLESADELVISVASFWEIAIKQTQKGFADLILPADWTERFSAAAKQYQLGMLGVEIPHCKEVESLPMHHRDPFDRILIAQARVEGLAVMTSDKAFDEYEVEIC